jgi:Zn-dependent protease
VRRFRVRVGRVFGIQLWLHGSWFVVFGLVTWLTASEFRDLYPRLASPVHIAMGLTTGAAFFGCLTLHELAHGLVSRRFGIVVRGITLFMFGGVAEIEGEIDAPATEFAVALIGPAISLSLGAAFGLAALFASDRSWSVVEGITGTLALVNLGVALFNLVPGLPLDGGRLLRAWLWRVWGDRRRATRVASIGGLVVAVALAGFGVVIALTGDLFGLWYVPMGAFLWFLATASGRAVPVSVGALALTDREGEAARSGS